MRKLIWLGVAGMLLGAGAWILQSATVATAAEKKTEEHGYIGATSCKACHKAKSKGEQYPIWKRSPHAQAYQTLLSEESKALAKKLGVKSPPEEAKECLKCHVTGYDAKPELLGKKYSKEEGITCESCHGPAKDWKKPHMSNIEKARKMGMLQPDEKTCLACHNEESPTFKGFDFKKEWPKIAHPAPKK